MRIRQQQSLLTILQLPRSKSGTPPPQKCLFCWVCTVLSFCVPVCGGCRFPYTVRFYTRQPSPAIGIPGGQQQSVRSRPRKEQRGKTKFFFHIGRFSTNSANLFSECHLNRRFVVEYLYKICPCLRFNQISHILLQRFQLLFKCARDAKHTLS